MSDARDKAVRDVVAAWVIEGSNPEYHRAMQRKLRQEWPTLAAAIEALMRETSR